MKSIVALLEDIGIPLDVTTLEILKMLDSGKEVSENIIADKLKLKINAVRKLLYSLHLKGVVAYTKRRDPKKKWWYIYFWSLDKEKIIQLCAEFKTQEIRKRKEQLETEQCFAFECKTCDKRFTYEDALESEYMCSLCGGMLEELTGNKICRRLQNEIQVLEAELASLQQQQQEVKPAKEPKPVQRKKPAPAKKKIAKKKVKSKTKPKSKRK